MRRTCIPFFSFFFHRNETWPLLAYKIIVVGDSGTGKTCFIRRLATLNTNQFDDALSNADNSRLKWLQIIFKITQNRRKMIKNLLKKQNNKQT